MLAAPVMVTSLPLRFWSSCKQFLTKTLNSKVLELLGQRAAIPPKLWLESKSLSLSCVVLASCEQSCLCIHRWEVPTQWKAVPGHWQCSCGRSHPHLLERTPSSQDHLSDWKFSQALDQLTFCSRGKFLESDSLCPQQAEGIKL